MVEFNTTEGQIGVYPGHIPLTVIVSPGILRIHEPEGERDAALHAGFAEILPDGISILAEVVEWPEEIDKNRAEEARIRAERKLEDNAGDGGKAEMALKRSVLRIRMAEREGK
jgi:F-type H+-transporting ATPase subunit epsilon